MQTVTVICDYCGAEYIKKENAIHNHNFCCISIDGMQKGSLIITSLIIPRTNRAE